MPKPTICIASSCIPRDTFSMHEEDGGYPILAFASFFSPLHAFEKACAFSADAFWAEDTSSLSPTFSKRCLYQDLTRNIPNFLAKHHQVDFLLLDTAILHLKRYELEDGTTCCCPKKPLLEHLCSKGILPAVKRTLPYDHLSKEDVRKRLERYADTILKHYDPERIVLFQTDYLPSYYDAEEDALLNFPAYPSSQEKRELIAFAFDILKDLLQCRTIPLPEGTLAFAQHRWGLMPLHYIPEYYDYALQAMDVVALSLPRAEEQARLDALCTRYTDIFKERYWSRPSYLSPPDGIISRLCCSMALLACRTLSHFCTGGWKRQLKRRYHCYRSMLTR